MSSPVQPEPYGDIHASGRPSPSGDDAALIPLTSLAECGCADLELPSGWEVGHVQSTIPLPILRTALFRTNEGGPWIGCETISAFRLAERKATPTAAQRCGDTLRMLTQQSVPTTALHVGAAGVGSGARGNAYFTLLGRRIWAQCSTYIHNPLSTPRGMLVEQVIFVDRAYRSSLRADIEQLTDEVHAAVIDVFDTVASHLVLDEGNPYGS